MLGADERVTVLQHVPFEPPGRIAGWALGEGLGIQRVRVWADDPVPEAKELDALVVLGGPMGVHDTPDHPWIEDELDLIRAAVEADVPVLGICLGAQLIAHALGGTVQPMEEREVGLFEVEATKAAGAHPLTEAWPSTFTPLHWHGDRFEAPPEATVLASSQACDEQAFAVGEQVLGLQFHLELASQDVGPLAEANPDDLASGPWVQDADEIEQRLEAADDLGTILQGTLDAWGEGI